MTQTAQIRNLGLVRTAAEQLVNRPASLPGIAVLYGPAGYGKTTAAIAIANETRAYFVQIRSVWNRKTLLEKVLVEMGAKPMGTIPQLLDQVCEQLAASGRMLMLDEFDYCTRNDGMIELIRDIYEGSQSTLLLLGEEMLPQKLKRPQWERIHGRVFRWIPAHPVSQEDARLLAPIYCPGIPVADDILAHRVKISKGSVRRLVVNLADIYETARVEGWERVDIATWGDRPFVTGEAPRRS